MAEAFCPSCIGRRMADTSTRLVDDVLPHVGYRQWVLTFPPPLAQKRLTLTEAGNVCYRLRKPYFDGRTEVVLSPTAFVKRLAAFVPPKGQHVIRYFGLLGPVPEFGHPWAWLDVGVGLDVDVGVSGDGEAT